MKGCSSAKWPAPLPFCSLSSCPLVGSLNVHGKCEKIRFECEHQNCQWLLTCCSVDRKYRIRSLHTTPLLCQMSDQSRQDEVGRYTDYKLHVGLPLSCSMARFQRACHIAQLLHQQAVETKDSKCITRLG